MKAKCWLKVYLRYGHIRLMKLQDHNGGTKRHVQRKTSWTNSFPCLVPIILGLIYVSSYKVSVIRKRAFFVAVSITLSVRSSVTLRLILQASHQVLVASLALKDALTVVTKKNLITALVEDDCTSVHEWHPHTSSRPATRTSQLARSEASAERQPCGGETLHLSSNHP